MSPVHVWPLQQHPAAEEVDEGRHRSLQPCQEHCASQKQDHSSTERPLCIPPTACCPDGGTTALSDSGWGEVNSGEEISIFLCCKTRVDNTQGISDPWG